jgi:hypothetical protein
MDDHMVGEYFLRLTSCTFYKGNILIPKSYQNTPSLCNSIMSKASLNTKDAHNNKKEQNKTKTLSKQLEPRSRKYITGADDNNH